MEFEHFVVAQNEVYEQALRELAEGRKQSCWMWFVFPQLKGLGLSATSRQFALDSIAAAERYLRHELLGSRLRECTQLVLKIKNRTARDIFGDPDWMKFRSSMTLFSLCSPPEDVFRMAINQYFGGVPDSKTLALCGESGGFQ